MIINPSAYDTEQVGTQTPSEALKLIQRQAEQFNATTELGRAQQQIAALEAWNGALRQALENISLNTEGGCVDLDTANWKIAEIHGRVRAALSLTPVYPSPTVTAREVEMEKVLRQAQKEMRNLGNLLNWNSIIPYSYADAINAISNQYETGVLDALSLAQEGQKP